MSYLPVPVSPAPIAKAAPRPGFTAGLGAMFSGLGFIASTPEVWPLALVPVGVGLAISVGLAGLAVRFIPPLCAAWFAGTSGVLAAVLGVVITGLAIVLGFIVGFGLAQPLSGSALERIVRRAEAKDGAPTWPEVGFADNLARSLGSTLVSAALGGPVMALLFLVSFVFPPAVVVTVPLKLAVIVMLAAWDLCDYPLSIRGVPIRERLAFMARNAGAMAGFGLSIMALSLLPCLLLLALPAGVAGAARLILKIERAEGRRLAPGAD